MCWAEKVKKKNPVAYYRKRLMDGGTFRLTYPVCLCKKKNLFWKSNVNVHIFFRSDINICSMNILLQRHDMDTERGSISGNVIKALADYLVPFFLQNQWNSSFEKVLAGDFCGRNLCVAVGSFYYRVDVFICEFSEWKFKRSSRSSSRIGVGPRRRPFSVRAQSRPPERVQGEP